MYGHLEFTPSLPLRRYSHDRPPPNDPRPGFGCYRYRYYRQEAILLTRSWRCCMCCFGFRFDCRGHIVPIPQEEVRASSITIGIIQCIIIIVIAIRSSIPRSQEGLIGVVFLASS